MNDKSILVGFTALLLISIIAGAVINRQATELRRLRRDMAFYNKTFLRKQGATSLWGTNGFNNPMVNYELQSFDGGIQWYACGWDTNGALKILGEAETVYPGLMKCLAGWDQLIEHVQKNGPIKFNNSEDLKVLQNAGFTVQHAN